MATQKTLFIQAVDSVKFEGQANVPTALYYTSAGIRYGVDALEQAPTSDAVHHDFKVALGNLDPGAVNRREIVVATGERKSPHALTNDFLKSVLDAAEAWIAQRGLKKAPSILIAEPLALSGQSVATDAWLANYRNHIRRMLSSRFKDIDFLPEPFAVFQYYRYGMRHPLVAQQKRHVALVIDFGGGTFDVSVIDTTAQGDIRKGGRNSRPLAASSRAVGGFFIDDALAESLLLDTVPPNRRQDIRTALGKYHEWRCGKVSRIEDLRADYQTFIRNFLRLRYEVELAKISVCRLIKDWSLEASFSSPPAARVNVPSEPLKAESPISEVRLDAYRIREVFVEKVWKTQLMPSLKESFDRARDSLHGEPISVVLLSGGSANIRWLRSLIEARFADELQGVIPLDLQADFQEIVSKGLAVECARRYFTEGHGDFRATTYNKLCLVLRADEGGIEVKTFRPQSPELPHEVESERGVLIPAASTIGAMLDRPLRWKVRLPHPPKHRLDYFFLRSSLDPDDLASLHNVVDKSVFTPSKTNFDQQIQVELSVKADGTTTPRFIYRAGGRGIEPVAVAGKPFYLDMTYGTTDSVSEGYLGLDFGSSNSSVSYVDQAAIEIFRERQGDSGWLELSDLVNVLPYPVSCPLERYLAEISEALFVTRALDVVEAVLTLACYTAYLEYCANVGRSTTRLFKSFGKRSAGPLLGLLRSCVAQLGKRASFSKGFAPIVDGPLAGEISTAIDNLAKSKHGKLGSLDHKRIVRMLCNISKNALEGKALGSFEDVKQERFGKTYRGVFRIARGGHTTFIQTFSYTGSSPFNDLDLYLVDLEEKRALSLTPLFIWYESPGARRSGREMAMGMYDCDGKSYKLVGRDEELVVDENYPDLLPLCDLLSSIRTEDKCLAEILEQVSLESRDDG